MASSEIAPFAWALLDSTQLDQRVVCPPGHPKEGKVVRPWVSLMLDLGSRSALTFEVTLTPPTPATMKSLLRRAWCHGENWPDLPTVPLPQFVRVDAGGEHKGAFQEALRQVDPRHPLFSDKEMYERIQDLAVQRPPKNYASWAHEAQAVGEEIAKNIQRDPSRPSPQVEIAQLKNELQQLKAKLAAGAGGRDLLDGVRTVGDLRLLVTRLDDGLDAKTLRDTTDRLKDKLGSGVVVLASADAGAGKVLVTAGVTRDLTGRIRANSTGNAPSGKAFYDF